MRKKSCIKTMTTRKKNIEHKTFCNISEDDAETFFDIYFENGSEILETSDSDSDEIDTFQWIQMLKSRKKLWYPNQNPLLF